MSQKLCPMCGTVMVGKSCSYCNYDEDDYSTENVHNNENTIKSSTDINQNMNMVNSTLAKFVKIYLIVILEVVLCCVGIFLKINKHQENVKNTNSIGLESVIEENSDFNPIKDAYKDSLKDTTIEENIDEVSNTLNKYDANFNEIDSIAMNNFGYCIRYIIMIVPYNNYCVGEKYNVKDDISWICTDVVDQFCKEWFEKYSSNCEFVIKPAGALNFEEDQFCIMIMFENFESSEQIDETVNNFMDDFYADWLNYIDDRCEELGYPVDRSKTFSFYM